MIDENTFVMPDAWRRVLHPRRDRPGVPEPPALHEGAAERVRSLVDAVRDGIEAVLALPGTDPGIAEAGLAHLRGEPNPLGAAAITVLTPRLNGLGARSRPSPGRLFADAWVADHGIVFAAHSFTELTGIVSKGGPTHEGVHSIGYRPPYQTFTSDGFDVDAARSLRARLAAAPDDVYADAVDRLEGARRLDWHRAVTAYLVPTREDWVEDLCTNPNGRMPDDFDTNWMLFCALGRPHQLAALGRQLDRGCERDVIATLLDGLGPEAVVPLLAGALDSHLDNATPLEFLAALPVDAAFQALLSRIRRPEVVLALRAAIDRFPARAVRLLSASAAPLAADLLSAHVRGNPAIDEDVVRDLPAGQQKAVRALLERIPQSTDLPPLLTEPPWTRPRAESKPVVIKDLPAPGTRAVTWAPGERDAWLARVPDRMRRMEIDFAEQAARFPPGSYPLYNPEIFLARGPEELLRPLMKGWEPENLEWVHEWLPPLVARLELDACDPAMSLARRNTPSYGQYVLPLLTDEIARTMADRLVRLKAAGRTARAWFRRHGHAAAPSLIPDALGKAGPARRAAEAALRFIAERDGHEPIVEAARVHGDKAAAAIEALLAADPLDDLPGKIPSVDWAAPRDLPQILLRDRTRALPDDAAGHVLTMLAMSKPGAEYAGVQVVRDLCDPASLAEFGWALFRRWDFSGAPSTENWALTQLALTGDDGTVRRLAPVIRAWPGDGGHAKAVTGLDILTDIGTDTALMHLNTIAQRVRYKGLKGRAQEKIEELALALELSGEQLADRLVPHFGLDADGTLTLDYGPRRFVIGFDELLRPTVADESGKVRKSLPKPGAKDDPELAPAAYKRFSELKKDVRTVARDQLSRLEEAMITGRRWSPAEFGEHLVRHPLVRHMVGRLVWLAEREDGTVTFFRMAEDGTYADAADETIAFPEEARIGVAHPVHLGDEVKSWSGVFADYEILQPFEQLVRSVHTLTDEERATGRLARFEGALVAVGGLFGLLGRVGRGWERGAPMDAGIEQEFYHSAPGCGVVIDLDPGIVVGQPYEDGGQVLAKVLIGASGSTGGLAPVLVSEVIADLTALTQETIR